MRDTLNKLSVFFIMICLLPVLAYGQNSVVVNADSVLTQFPMIESFKSISKLDPNRAAIYSAVFPGLGQIYNKQFWKLPIIYGGAMVIGHYIKYNQDFYNTFRNAYLAEVDGDPRTINPYNERFGKDALQRNAEKFRRDRDFLIIIGVVYYLLNIVDAHVDSHLIEFDINSDLSFRPSYHMRNQHFVQSAGFSLVINLSK